MPRRDDDFSVGDPEKNIIISGVAFVLLPVAIWLSQRTSKNELEAVVLAHPPIRLGRHANKKRQGETFLYPYSSPSLPEMNVL